MRLYEFTVGLVIAASASAERRQAKLARRILEQRTALRPERNVRVTAVACEIGEGLRHERRAQAVLLGDRLDHELEEGVPVGGLQAGVVLPVHLELSVRVLVVVLVRVPSETDHAVANLGDHLIAPHQRLLVVAGLGLRIRVVG